MTEEEKMLYWIWLTQIKGVGPVTENLLLDQYYEPWEVYDRAGHLKEECDFINAKRENAIAGATSLDQAKRILDSCDKKNIAILTRQSEFYAKTTRTRADAPILLYTKGQLQKKGPSAGIVGARRCTQETKNLAARLTEECLEKGLTIISGMAKGVDAYAHTVCLNNGGYTIAVLGNGLDICYPKEHTRLMEKIEEQGTLLSEYPPGTMPSQYTFPQRNRIIAAWSDSLIVIGAGRGSGALITAGFADEESKPVEYYEVTKDTGTFIAKV